MTPDLGDVGHVNVRLRSSGSFSLRSSWPAARFDLLMLTPHREPVDMHGNGHHDFGVPDGLPGSVVDVAGFDPFPFGPAVLEPDFDLDLAEFERVRDLRALEADGIGVVRAERQMFRPS